MTNLLIIIILLASFVLGFFVLVQKPKGGGLSGTFGSLGTQVMGVKQSGDVMEKGTWYTMGLIAALCIFSVFTLPIQRVSKAPAAEQSQQQAPQEGQPQAPAAK
jgi:preprotein translocase subunit SecG